MAEFLFTGPDGSQYKITGDNERDAILAFKKSLGGENVIATTPDGGRFVRGESGKVSFASPGYSTSDPETVKRLMAGEGVKEVVQSTTDKLTIDQNPIAARANEFVRGAPFIGSYADDAVGLVNPKAAKAMRQTTAAMQREKPGQTAALNLAGGIAAGVPMAAAAAPTQLPSWIATASPAVKGILGMVGGATAGGIEGLTYGYGEGEGDARIRNAKTQGAVGAGLGGLLGLASPFIGSIVGEAIKRHKNSDVSLIAKEFGLSDDAARMLKTAFQNNDENAVERILRAGPEATLADAGRSGQALMDAAAQTGGDALNIVDSAVTGRLSRAQRGANQALDNAMGPVRGPIQAAEEIAEQSRPVRKAAYDAAYNTPINYATQQGRAVEETLGRVPSDLLQKAIKEANDEMQSLGLKNMQIMAQIGDDGAVRFVEMPNVRQLDELKKALDRLVTRDEFGRVTAEGLRPSRLAGEVKRATVDATGGDSGTYAQALKVGGDKIAEDNALRLGRDIFKENVTREEFIRELGGMSADARKMAKAGVRSQVDDMLARAKSTLSDTSATAEEIQEAKKVIKLFFNRDAREKMGALLGPKGAADLYGQLDILGASFENAASVAQNSKTAIRGAIQGTGNDILTPGPVGTLARGKPIETTQRLTQFLLSTTPEDDAARAAEMWAEIAQVLSQKRGSKSATAALKYVEKAMAGQPLKDAEKQLILNQMGASLPVASGQGARFLTETAN